MILLSTLNIRNENENEIENENGNGNGNENEIENGNQKPFLCMTVMGHHGGVSASRPKTVKKKSNLLTSFIPIYLLSRTLFLFSPVLYT